MPQTATITPPSMAALQDRTAMNRILFAVLVHENRNLNPAIALAVTQTSYR
jgi:hypothetical protein